MTVRHMIVMSNPFGDSYWGSPIIRIKADGSTQALMPSTGQKNQLAGTPVISDHKVMCLTENYAIGGRCGSGVGTLMGFPLVDPDPEMDPDTHYCALFSPGNSDPGPYPNVGAGQNTSPLRRTVSYVNCIACIGGDKFLCVFNGNRVAFGEPKMESAEVPLNQISGGLDYYCIGITKDGRYLITGVKVSTGRVYGSGYFDRESMVGNGNVTMLDLYSYDGVSNPCKIALGAAVAIMGGDMLSATCMFNNTNNVPNAYVAFGGNGTFANFYCSDPTLVPGVGSDFEADIYSGGINVLVIGSALGVSTTQAKVYDGQELYEMSGLSGTAASWALPQDDGQVPVIPVFWTDFSLSREIP